MNTFDVVVFWGQCALSCATRLAALTIFALGLALPAFAAPQTRTSAFVYDGTSGLLTKEIIEPGNSDFCLVTAYQYDDYGNKKKAITRNCNGEAGTQPGVNNEAIGPTGDARIQVPDASGTLVTVSIESTTEYAADPNGGWSAGQFPTTSTNALGQFETKQYDVRFGAVTKLTGPNLLDTEWVYDGFGRKVLEKRADGTGTQWTYEYCVGVNYGTTDCPTIGGAAGAYVVVETPIVVSTNAKNGPTSKTYYDGLNREIRKETEGSDVAGSSKAIYQDTRYNSQGRPYQKSRPYYSGEFAYWTELTYDSLGRIVIEERPDENVPAGAETHTAYSAVDGKPTVTVTNSLGQSRTTTKNSQGQVVLVKDAANQTLSFNYDSFGNLTQTTDALGNATVLEYDIRGRKTVMHDPDMGTWTYTYNALGQLIRQSDPVTEGLRTEAGSTCTADPECKRTLLTYDKLGRLVKRAERDLISVWHYDHYKGGGTCAKGIGKVCDVELVDSQDANAGYLRHHIYDSKGRPIGTETTVENDTYTASVVYDDITGRLTTQTYPSAQFPATGLVVSYGYTNLGYLKDLKKDSDSGPLYWEAMKQDAEGHLLEQRFGNNVVTTQTYAGESGRLTHIQAGAGSVQDLVYQYDRLGNTLSRTDNHPAMESPFGNVTVQETFTYDNLNRMEFSQVSADAGILGKTYTYDVLGNITSRSDVSLSAANNGYVYPVSGAGSVRPHAVSRVNLLGGGHRAYYYDANGNLDYSIQYTGANPDPLTQVKGGGRKAYFTSFNMPSVIHDDAEVNVQLEFSLYGPEHQRVVGSVTTATGTRRTLYLNPGNNGGLAYEVETLIDNSVEERHFLTVGGQVVAVVKRIDGTWNPPRYFHRDNLGSTTAITDDNGNVIERLAYEPFGKRRFADGTTAGTDDPGNTIRSLITVRGFTNHEHLDELGLIHMNGRVYDPAIGRFMSADFINQDPMDLQAYNRYTYVRNNPLMYTDPNGQFWEWVLAAIIGAEVAKQLDIIDTSTARLIQGIAVGVAIGSPQGFALGGLEGAVVAGTAAGFVSSDFSIEGAIYGGISAGLFYGVGSLTGMHGADSKAFGELKHLANIAGHAAVGCAMATAQGGKCSEGAASAGFAATFTPLVPKGTPGLMIASAIGGTASVLGGGKFANGAATAAFGYLFNQMAYEMSVDGSNIPARESPAPAGLTFTMSALGMGGAVTLDSFGQVYGSFGAQMPDVLNVSLTYQAVLLDGVVPQSRAGLAKKTENFFKGATVSLGWNGVLLGGGASKSPGAGHSYDVSAGIKLKGGSPIPVAGSASVTPSCFNCSD